MSEPLTMTPAMEAEIRARLAAIDGRLPVENADLSDLFPVATDDSEAGSAWDPAWAAFLESSAVDVKCLLVLLDATREKLAQAEHDRDTIFAQMLAGSNLIVNELRPEVDQLRADLAQARADNERLTAERNAHGGSTCGTFHPEWVRVEAENHALQADAQRVRAWAADYFPKRYAILSKQADEERKGGGPVAGLVTGGMLNECQLTHELVDRELRPASDTGEKS